MNTLLRIAALLLLAGTAGAAVQRVDDAGANAPRSAVASAELAAFQGDGMTLSEAVEQVRRQYGGRIVGAETQVSGGREIHIIKVLTDDGKVKTVRITGRKV